MTDDGADTRRKPSTPSPYALRLCGTLRMTNARTYVALPEGFRVSVARPNVGLALDGDEVLVEIEVGRHDMQGRVIEITRRAHERLTGIVHVTRDGAWLHPDGAVSRPILLVGDIPPLQSDDVICGVELDFSETRALPQGTVACTFGPRGSRDAEMRAVVWRVGIAGDHSRDVIDEGARRIEELGPPPDAALDPNPFHLVRCAGVPIGFGLREGIDGRTRASVAVPDVTDLVPEESLVDVDARARGATLHMTDAVLAMLPGAVRAAGQLEPPLARRAIVIDLVYDGDGRLVDHAISRRTITIAGSDATHAGRASAILEDAERIARDLASAHAAGDPIEHIRTRLRALGIVPDPLPTDDDGLNEVLDAIHRALPRLVRGDLPAAPQLRAGVARACDRYVDLVLQRAVRDVLDGSEPARVGGRIREIFDHQHRASQVVDAEEELRAIDAVMTARRHVGERFDIEVLESREWGALCRIGQLGVEAVCVADLGRVATPQLEVGTKRVWILRGASLARRVLFVELPQA